MGNLSQADFLFFHELLLKESGLDLKPTQEYLLMSRLEPVVKKLEIGTISELTTKLRSGRDLQLVKTVVEAMTTNETSFFRDAKPFVALEALVPEIIKSAAPTQRTLRVWSAACSSGQECYSVAMVLENAIKKHIGWKCEIIGTDIDEEIIAKAKNAVYSQFEVQRGLTMQKIIQYFDQEGNSWKLKNSIRSMVSFRKVNLLNNISGLGKFDIIFCRNVLIYFNMETKKEVLKKLSERLSPNGLVFLGAAETVINHSESFDALPDYHGVLKGKIAA